MPAHYVLLITEQTHNYTRESCPTVPTPGHGLIKWGADPVRLRIPLLAWPIAHITGDAFGWR